MPARMRLALVLSLAGCELFGCAHYATWHDFARGPHYRPPASIAIAVRRSDTVQAADEAGFVDATARALQDELRERHVQGVVADTGAHSPRLELDFVVWQPGRGVVMRLTDSSRKDAFFAVLVKAHAEDDRITLQGRVDGADLGANSGTREAAEAAARAIARAVADAEYTPKAPKSLETSLP